MTTWELPLYLTAIPKKWRALPDTPVETVERAALRYLELQGWVGYWREGGLILNLIKAMSFPQLEPRNRTTYIEALYAQNVAFEQDRYERACLLMNLRNATKDQILENFNIMNSKIPHTECYESITSTSAITLTDFFPDLEAWMFTGLYSALGNEKLHAIASIFATDPYEYRRGWPDLTVWKEGQVRFIEVKAPGDRIGPSQRHLCEKILLPLSLDCSIAKIRATTLPTNS